jgi:PPOX class probable F420-dependent enzyme
MTIDPRMLEFVARPRLAVLATVKRDGRPQLSTVGYAYDPEQQLFRISVTADRAKTRNLERDARLTLHVSSDDSWSWVAVEGTAELSPVAAAPDDDTVEELVAYYRAVSGEHEDWDDYRSAMVRERRLVIRFRPEHLYGRLAG